MVELAGGVGPIGSLGLRGLLWQISVWAIDLDRVDDGLLVALFPPSENSTCLLFRCRQLRLSCNSESLAGGCSSVVLSSATGAGPTISFE